MTTLSSPDERAPAHASGDLNADEWLPVRVVADRLHVLPDTLRDWINRGVVPCRVMKVNRVWRLNAADVDRYLSLVEGR